MSEMIFAQNWSGVDAAEVSERLDPIYGPVTVFHDVIIAREIVHPFKAKNGKMLMAYKSADELERYWPWVDGRWAIAGRHPKTPVIVSPGDIAGRTVNPRFVKNLKDTKTGRPNIRGIKADLEVFNDRVSPEILRGMLNGSLPSVSIGYLHAQEMISGSWNGYDYDFRQTNMFHDHLSFGIRKGRCAFPACGIGADEMFKAYSFNIDDGQIDLTNMETIVGHDPEETETHIRIDNPGVGECEVTATIQISEEQGIQATYCGESKTVRTYIFEKAKDWTMEKAKTWVSEHKEGGGDILFTRLIEYDMALSAVDQEEPAGPRTEEERAKAHYGLTDEVWDALSAKAKTALIAALPERGEGGDISEDDPEFIMCIDDEISKGKTLEEAREICKGKTQAAPEPVSGEDEVARSKRLLSDPRLKRDTISR